MYIHASKNFSELKLEIKRKIFHIIALLLWIIPISFLSFFENIVIFILVIGINTAIVLKMKPFYLVFDFFIKHFERDKNLKYPGIQSLYANIGIFLTYLIFKELALVGIVVLAVGDGLSTLVGKVFGKNKLFYNKDKTWEGCIAFFIGAFLILSFFKDLKSSILIAGISSLLETLNVRIDDNFILPLSATLIAYLM